MGDFVHELPERFLRELDLKSPSGQQFYFMPIALLKAFAENHSGGGQSSSRCLYIGIDFGTTYSGVAWAWSGDLDNINIVTNWSTRGRNLSHIRDDAKAPTALYYKDDSIYWGHGISEDEDAIKWFKLLLLKEEDLDEDIRRSPYLKKARKKLAELGKSPEEAVADYLSLLWDHTLTSMKRARGAGAVDGLPFKVALTVPAIWKPYAHEKMREAARAAGILSHRVCGETSLILVSEPEAAALATLNEFRNCHSIEKGDIYVVCDVGGGTADLISYKIKETGPLMLYESVEGKGKLCGGIFVDETFQTLIKQRIGLQRWEKLTRASKVKLMNDEWEFGIKRAFDGEPNKKWTCQLPPDAVGRFGPHRLDDSKADAPMVRGQIQFTTDHIRRVFGKVVNDIRTLINAQIRNIQEKEGKLPKAIILVGGFGSCEYLYQILTKEHEKSNIEILQSSGKGPWTAICRGAVIRAASNAVVSRICRASYGVDMNVPFVEGVHTEEDKVLNEFKGKYYARSQMQWYVKRGQNFDVLEPVKFGFTQSMRRAMKNNTYEVTIFECDDAVAPTRKTSSVRPLCEITIQLEVSYDDLPESLDMHGRPYKRYAYGIEMVREDAGLQFFLVRNGRRLGAQNIAVQMEVSSSENRPTWALGSR